MSQQCNSLLNFSPNIQNLKTIGWEFNCHSNTNSLCLVSDPSHTPAHNPASNPALSCAHIAFAHPALKSPIKYFACRSMLPGKLSDNARLLPDSGLATESLVILTSPVLPRKVRCSLCSTHVPWYPLTGTVTGTCVATKSVTKLTHQTVSPGRRCCH